jgi:hypothetical protein
MIKRLSLLALIAGAVVIALSTVANASAPGPTLIRSQTVEKGVVYRLSVGQRLKAPRFKGRVKHYQWLRCNTVGQRCAQIKGATRSIYQVSSADVSHTLRVRAVLQGSKSAVSGVTTLVGLPLPVNTAVPVITDGGQGGGSVGAPTTVVVGDVLSGTNGTWNIGAIRYTYQWEDCNSSGTSCVAISGATTNAYTVQSSDVGYTIVFQVTAYNY